MILLLLKPAGWLILLLLKNGLYSFEPVLHEPDLELVFGFA